jgi:hypothetical protein
VKTKEPLLYAEDDEEWKDEDEDIVVLSDKAEAGEDYEYEDFF